MFTTFFQREKPDALVVGALCVAIGACLLLFHDQIFLYNDAFQHVSATRSLLAGTGYSTSIVYYDQNYTQGVVPALQTVWPPGIALAGALPALLGTSATFAVFLVSFAGLLACPLLLLASSRSLELRPSDAIGAASSTILLGLLLYITWRAGAEGPFVAGTLLALLGACRLGVARSSKTQALLLIAIGTTVAVLMRYNGLFLVISSSLWFLVLGLRRRSFVPIYQGFVSLLPAAATGVIILLRNLRVSGSLTGGPVSEDWASPREVLATLVDAVVSTTGWNPTFAWQKLALLALLALLAGFALLMFWYAVRDGGAAPRDATDAVDSARADANLFCMLYLATTLALLVAVLAPRALDALGYRYLLPLVPFAVFSLILTRFRFTRVPQWLQHIVIGLLLAGNAAALAGERQALIDNDAIYDVTGALASPYGGGSSLREWLDARVDESAPILSSSAQRLGGLTGWPVLGLTPGFYSLSDWNTADVHGVVEQYGVCYVLLYSTDTEAAQGGGREFFAALRRGELPEWLSEMHDTPQLRVFRVQGCAGE